MCEEFMKEPPLSYSVFADAFQETFGVKFQRGRSEYCSHTALVVILSRKGRLFVFISTSQQSFLCHLQYKR